MFGFNNKKKGYGFGPMPGFDRRKNSIANGNFDRDRKPDRSDCDALNFRKQDGGEVFKDGIKWKIKERREGKVLLYNKNKGTWWVLEEEL